METCGAFWRAGSRRGCFQTEYGLVAQLGERRVRNAEVEGSIPFESTSVGHSGKSRSARLLSFCEVQKLNIGMGAVPVCVAIEKEQVVAGYVNQHDDGWNFTMDDVNQYIVSLWDAGCGPIRLNFTQQEMKDYLDRCDGICLAKTPGGYAVDKTHLDIALTKEEARLLSGDEKRTKSYALFCELRVDLRTPHRLLDAMGYRFMYA